VPTEFKRVPAIDRCFAILQLLAGSRQALGISEIARALGLHKGTVFNTLHTLTSLEVLEQGPDGKFRFGTGLYLLGHTAGSRSELIRIVRPCLETINSRTGLTAFLGVRSGLKTVIVDKADSATDLKISSEVGMRMPLLGGAHGKALMSQLSDDEVDAILVDNELEPFTPNSIVDPSIYRKEIRRVRRQGIAYDREEYIEGVVALSAPVKTHRFDLQAAVWAVGLKRQAPEETLPEVAGLIKDLAKEINRRFDGAGEIVGAA